MKQEYLEAAFDEMEKQYGTIENYFSAGLGIDAEKLVANMIKFVLEGISPVEEAPPVPPNIGKNCCVRRNSVLL